MEFLRKLVEIKTTYVTVSAFVHLVMDFYNISFFFIHASRLDRSKSESLPYNFSQRQLGPSMLYLVSGIHQISLQFILMKLLTSQSQRITFEELCSLLASASQHSFYGSLPSLSPNSWGREQGLLLVTF